MKAKYLLVFSFLFIIEQISAQNDPNIYGNNPNEGWTFTNSSTHAIIIMFKNNMGFKLNPNGGWRRITAKGMIDRFQYTPDDNRPGGYDRSMTPQYPSGRKYWSYNIIVLDGGKIKTNSPGNGVIIFIDEDNKLQNNQSSGIENAILKAIDSIKNQMPEKSTIAVINISSQNNETSSFIIDEIMYRLVLTNKFIIVDRDTLDTLRTEQNFQLSGEVDDNSAISIGKLLGAGIVITGSVTGSGSTQRLTIKALNVQTAQVITMARETIN